MPTEPTIQDSQIPLRLSSGTDSTETSSVVQDAPTAMESLPASHPAFQPTQAETRTAVEARVGNIGFLDRMSQLLGNGLSGVKGAVDAVTSTFDDLCRRAALPLLTVGTAVTSTGCSDGPRQASDNIDLLSTPGAPTSAWVTTAVSGSVGAIATGYLGHRLFRGSKENLADEISATETRITNLTKVHSPQDRIDAEQKTLEELRIRLSKLKTTSAVVTTGATVATAATGVLWNPLVGIGTDLDEMGKEAMGQMTGNFVTDSANDTASSVVQRGRPEDVSSLPKIHKPDSGIEQHAESIYNLTGSDVFAGVNIGLLVGKIILTIIEKYQASQPAGKNPNGLDKTLKFLTDHKTITYLTTAVTSALACGFHEDTIATTIITGAMSYGISTYWLKQIAESLGVVGNQGRSWILPAMYAVPVTIAGMFPSAWTIAPLAVISSVTAVASLMLKDTGNATASSPSSPGGTQRAGARPAGRGTGGTPPITPPPTTTNPTATGATGHRPGTASPIPPNPTTPPPLNPLPTGTPCPSRPPAPGGSTPPPRQRRP